MKPLYIIMLCVMLLIQGIGQSYAAQMMTAQATAPVVGSMDVMPCHETQPQASVIVNDCCGQDCQCDMLTCAMIMSLAILHNKAPSHQATHYLPASFTAIASNLYRPPISA